jgi:hypothetical protein
VVPIHRHPTKDESFVILRGKVRVTTHNDDGSIIEDVVLSQESGNYGVDIAKGVWHMVEALELGCSAGGLGTWFCRQAARCARGAAYGAGALPGTVCSGDEKSRYVKL